ncbi:hypothetical protein FACS189419_05040 [Planctomycetales bacterium]|nr:hypothetical protein FACS189419_05040 [Planctomycetales bacterium]
MFDPKKWIRESHEKNTVKRITIGGETADIRCLTSSQFNDIQEALRKQDFTNFNVLALQYGLCNSIGGSYSYQEMAQFYDACPLIADKIVSEIFEYHKACSEALLKEIEATEKNSVTTPSPQSIGGGVGNTDKTPDTPTLAEVS